MMNQDSVVHSRAKTGSKTNNMLAQDICPQYPDPSFKSQDSESNMRRSVSFGETSLKTVSSVEYQCSNHEHFTTKILNEVFSINVDRMFDLLFSDSALLEEYHRQRKISDVVQSAWSEDCDENGCKIRTVKRVFTIAHRSVRSVEKQIMFPESQTGLFYLIDGESEISGMPYSNNFDVVTRYCISKVADCHCRLRITSATRFQKKVWGIVKNHINKITKAAIADNFSHLAKLLRELARKSSSNALVKVSALRLNQPPKQESSISPSSSQESSKVPQSISTPLTETSPSPLPTQIKPQTDSSPVAPQKQPYAVQSQEQIAPQESWSTFACMFVVIIGCCLIFSSVINTLMYWNITKMEERCEKLFPDHKINPEVPSSMLDWQQLQNRQMKLHFEELDLMNKLMIKIIKSYEVMQTVLDKVHTILEDVNQMQDQHEKTTAVSS